MPYLHCQPAQDTKGWVSSSDECHDIATTCVLENLLKTVMIMVHGRDATAELLAQTEGWQHLAVLQK